MQNKLTKSAKRLALKLVLAVLMLFAFLGTTEIAQAQYCTPYWQTYMEAAQFYIRDAGGNVILNWSGRSGLGAFYSNTCNLSPNQTYTFYWHGGYYQYSTSYAYQQHVGIYIDANRNNNFETPSGGTTSIGGEWLWTSWANGNNYNYLTTFTGSFRLPSSGSSGTTRLRIVNTYYYYAAYYSAFPLPCGSSYNYYGSYLDFNVNQQYVIQNDAGISAVESPTDNFDSYQPQDIKVTLKNFSKNRMTSCTVNWSLGGVTQTPYNWSGTLDSGQTTTVTLRTGHTFVPSAPWGPFNIQSWTSNIRGTNTEANSYGDANPNNDRKSADIRCILDDAGFISADAMLPLDYGENDVVLTIKNYAPKPLSRVTVNYSINGIAQSPYTVTFSPPLAANSTADVIVGTYFFGAGNIPYLIEAETSNPNGLTDQVPANDGGQSEVYKALQAGTYTVGPRESDYETLEELMQFISYWGIAGPVDVLIRQGTYYLSTSIAPRGGRQFPLSFESITRRPLDVVIYNDGSENDYIFQFDGYDNITIRNLTFEAPGKFFEFINGNENFIFDNCIFNAGQGRYGVLGSPFGSNDIFSVMGDLNNFELANSQLNGGESSIYIEYGMSSNWWIHHNEFNGANFGFIVNDYGMSSNITIENNLFNGNNTPWGVAIFGAENSYVLNNRFNGINADMNYGWGAAVLIRSGYAVNNIYTGMNEIADNTITTVNAYGIYLMYGSSILVENNIVSSNGNGYDRWAAIYDEYSTGSMIHHNTVNVSDMHGIYTSGTDGLISYNKVFGQGTGSGMHAGIVYDYASGIDNADNEVAVSGMPGIVNLYGHELYFAYNSVLSNDNSYPAYAHNPMMQQPDVITSGKRHISSDASVLVDANPRATKDGGDNKLGEGPGTTMMLRNIFQNNAGGLAGYIEDQNYGLESDNNNWWTSGSYVVQYNYTDYDFAGYQGASGQEANSSSVQAMFMGPQDLRLTHVDADLYYTDQMLFGQEYMDYEETDLAGEARSRAFYKGAYSIYPTIEVTEEPEDVVDCYGTTEHSFVVVANVDYNAELSYQWYKDGVAIFGETGPILYINDPLAYEMGAVYRCKISGTGEAEDMWTRPAMLYTLRPTEITRQPFDLRNDLGTVATFEIDMHIYKEAPAMFQPDIQWYRGGLMLTDNDRLAGTKSSIMTIRDVQPDDLGDDYYVVISGLCGADTSEAITLSEIPSLTVDALPSTGTVCAGSDAAFQVVASSSISGVTISYQWHKDGVALVDGPRVNGAMTEQLLISMAEAGDAGEYTCVVTLEGWDQETTNATTLTVEDKPMLTTDLEASVSVQTDKTLDLMVEATGTGVTYQWYKDDEEIAGATMSTYTKDSVTSADEGTYKVVVSNNCGDVVSAECVVTVTPFILMDVEGEAGELMLNQNSPNPFSIVTTIGFIMPEAGYARLTLTDVSGKEIAVIADGTMGQGMNSYEVDATAMKLTAGVYFYTLTVNGKSITKTMVVLK